MDFIKNRQCVHMRLFDLLDGGLVEVGLAGMGDFVQQRGFHVELWIQVNDPLRVVA